MAVNIYELREAVEMMIKRHQSDTHSEIISFISIDGDAIEYAHPLKNERIDLAATYFIKNPTFFS